jgi:hypothetical protein
MSTQRYISTSFWNDKWIRSLNPSERYLYMYLLTNPQTTIAGVYQITMDRIAFDTGYDERTLYPMFKRFAQAGKAYYFKDEWVILPSWPKHQRWEIKSTIKRGIDAVLLKVPENVKKYMVSIGYQYPIIGYEYRPSYSDLEFDLDTDTDTDLYSAHSPVENFPQNEPDPVPASPGAVAHKEKAPAVLPSETSLHADIVAQFAEDQHSKTLMFSQGKSIAGREMKAVKDILTRCSHLAPENPGELARDIVKAFYHLTHAGGIKASYLPSQLSTQWIWLKVIEEMRRPLTQGVDRQRIVDMAEGRVECDVF